MENSMKDLIGTWKAAGTVTKTGQLLSQKPVLSFTFRDNGEGSMRYLVVMSAPFTWKNSGSIITIRNTQNSSSQEFELRDGKLYTANANGTKTVFIRSGKL